MISYTDKNESQSLKTRFENMPEDLLNLFKDMALDDAKKYFNTDKINKEVIKMSKSIYKAYVLGSVLTENHKFKNNMSKKSKLKNRHLQIVK